MNHKETREQLDKLWFNLGVLLIRLEEDGWDIPTPEGLQQYMNNHISADAGPGPAKRYWGQNFPVLRRVIKEEL